MSPEVKACTQCRHIKPLTEFAREPRTTIGYQSRCKACKYRNMQRWRTGHRARVNTQQAQKRRAKNPEIRSREERARERMVRTHKRCRVCGKLKALEQFRHKGKNNDGTVLYSYRCKACDQAYQAGWYGRNQPKVRAAGKTNRSLRLASDPVLYRGKRCTEAYRRRSRISRAPTDRSVTLAAVWARDGGRCQVCRQRTLPPHTGKRGDPRQATIDHIIPVRHPDYMHVGHVWTNVRLAHMGCNSGKAKTTPAQLLLFGT